MPLDSITISWPSCLDLQLPKLCPLDLDAMSYDYEACMAAVKALISERDANYLTQVTTLGSSKLGLAVGQMLQSSRFQTAQGLKVIMDFLSDPKSFVQVDGTEIAEYFRIPVDLLPNSGCLGFFASTITAAVSNYGIDFQRYFLDVPKDVEVNTAKIFLFRPDWPERTLRVYHFCLCGIQYLFVRCGGGSYQVYLQAENRFGSLFDDYLATHLGYHVVRVESSIQFGVTKTDLFEIF